MEALAPTTTAAAFCACALVSYDDLKKVLAKTDRTSTAGLLLAATIWQCEGDVLRAESTLRRAVEAACGQDRAYAVDCLVPLLISRGLFARAGTMLSLYSATSLSDEVTRRALRSIIDAACGDIRRSEAEVTAIRETLVGIDDDVLRLKVNQRLALAAYYRGDAVAALEEVGQGLRAAELLDASRAAATLHSVAYATQYSLLGDFEAAWRHALALGREAWRGGDESCRALSRVALYELAAERADDESAANARADIDAKPLPEQYRERFSVGIADALRLAWSGDLSTCRNVLLVLKDTVGRTDSERALCRALLALLGVAMGDHDAARRFSRQAISTSARPTKRIAAYELRYRRLARALAAIAGEFVGDVVRGRRAIDARFVREDPDISALLDLRFEADVAEMPANLRGYARVAAIARERLSLRAPSGPLTGMEIEIVRLIASGRKAPQIADLLSRSPHTIRTHLRNASAKLGAHGRIQLLDRARQVGALKDLRTKGVDGATT